MWLKYLVLETSNIKDVETGNIKGNRIKQMKMTGCRKRYEKRIRDKAGAGDCLYL